MKNLYHLTGSQKFYGQSDPKTYYSVPGNRVWSALRYMANEFNLDAVFVYRKDAAIGKNTFVGTYSKKYDNFRTADKFLHSTYQFN